MRQSNQGANKSERRYEDTENNHQTFFNSIGYEQIICSRRDSEESEDNLVNLFGSELTPYIAKAENNKFQEGSST